MDVKDLVINRRSIYGLGNKQILPEKEISALVNQCLKYAPSAFNSQSSRIALLYGNSYQKFWEIVLEELKKVTPEDRFALTKNKITSFAQGLGTVLFFEDRQSVSALQAKYPLYAKNFDVWSEHGNAMLQYMVWQTFAARGASLQHYNPLIDEKVEKEFGLPPSWRLIAQMPFGSITTPPDDKSFLSIEERLKVLY